MSAEAAPIAEVATTREPQAFASDERQKVSDSVAQLLSSGRVLSEILQSVKMRADRNEATNPDGAAEPDTQTIRISDESRTNRSNSEISHLPQPIERTGAHKEGRQCGGGLNPSTNAYSALDIGPLDDQHSSQADHIREARHITLSKPSGVTLFWLILALSLALFVVAGQSFVEGGAGRKATETAARANIDVVHSGGDQPILPDTQAGEAAAKRLSTEPDRSELQTAPPDRVEGQTAQPYAAKPQRAPPDRAEHPTEQSNHANAQLTSEQIRALLDRGDAFLGMGDVEAARLLYERAVAAGNADAAIRLGATFDPAFLTRARLRNVRGDLTAAQYWYRHARELEPSQPRN